MKATIVKINEDFLRGKVEANQLLFYHDECTWELKKKTDVEYATLMIKHWFKEAPKLYGVDIMEAGDIKAGNTYMEVH